MRSFFVIALLAVSSLAYGQVAIPHLRDPIATFAYETKDWDVAPTAAPASFPGRYPYHSPTPTTIPGARTITTLELDALLKSNSQIVVVDVLGNTQRRTTISNASWLPEAGDANFFDAEKARFAAILNMLTGGDKLRPIVFLCQNSECWMSYNASLHALEAGYKDVIWYRGGTDAWRGANLDVKPAERTHW